MRRQNKKKLFFISSALLSLLTGCEKYYLSLTNQTINVDSLASVYALTPDKRKESPPLGEMIVLDFRVPKQILCKDPKIDLYVLYGNYTEKKFTFPITKRMGYFTYKDLNEEFIETKGIITYRAEIRLDSGEIYKDWTHQLWARLITVEEKEPAYEEEPVMVVEDLWFDEHINRSVAESTNSLVEEKSIQGSVTDTQGEISSDRG